MEMIDMARQWIAVDAALPRHPKLRKLANALGLDRRAALSLLIEFWGWASEFAPDGDLSRFDDDDISAGVNWENDASIFVESLLLCGFIDDKRAIHDWDQYGGKLHNEREKNKAKIKEWREKQKAKDERETDTEPDSNGHVTVTEPLPNRIRGEERRGEEKRGEIMIPPIVPPSGDDAPVYPPEFSLFWEAYPKKVGKGDAFKAWKKLRPSKELQAKILAAVGKQKRSEQWTKEGGQYIPNASTWINQGRWDDELKEAKGNGREGNGGNQGDRRDDPTSLKARLLARDAHM